MSHRISFQRPLMAGNIPGAVLSSPDPAVDEPAVAEALPISSRATVLLLLAHVPLALLMSRIRAPLATTHALTILAVGAWAAITGRRDRIVLVVGYIAGAEVLWRMTGAQVNWEFGKYAASAIMLLDLIRRGQLRPAALPLCYFALLIPSTVLTLTAEPWPVAVDQLSFNLSGPFALMVCGWFFSNVRISAESLRLLFLTVIGPIIGVLTIAVFNLLTSTDVLFSDASNFAASGGYGPNQVSAVLGAGALLALFTATDGRMPRGVRGIAGAFAVAFAVQSALTFSRAGLAAAAVGAAVAACFAAGDYRVRGKLIPLAAAVFMVGYFVFPYLDAYTGGEMSVRFQDNNSTGRVEMVQQEFDLWMENPILGVGPGGARVERMGQFFLQGGYRVRVDRVGREYAAHTEYARLLSEHGTFGLAALILLGIASVANVRRAPDPLTKALVGGLIAWSVMYMFSAAMRTFLPSFAFGLGFATFVADGADSTDSGPAEGGSSVRNGLRRLTSGHPSLRRGRGPDAGA